MSAGAASARVAPAPPAAAALEVAALALALLSYIWLWEGAFRWHTPLILLLYFGIGVETHWRRGERPRDIGLRLDNLGRALRLVSSWIAPVAFVALTAGLLLKSWHFPPLAEGIGSVAFGVLWGGAQQYGLVCVFYRRLCELLPGRRWPIVASGLLFALFHVPNPFLMAVTLTLGIVACWLYSREPNLLVLGFWHGLTSFVLFYSLPVALTIEMRVGPQILPYLNWPFW
jgi:Type II CAAX prenyl endopeptidase Rce1-like